MNGDGTITEKGVTRTVTFYKDLELNAEGVGSYNGFHWNLIFVLIFYVLMFLGSVANSNDAGTYFGFGIAFYIVSLINLCTNKTIQ